MRKWKKRKSDYSGDKWWKHCIGRFALSQQNFPLGVGINESIRVKERYWCEPLYTCPYPTFKEILKELEQSYLKMKTTYQNDTKKTNLRKRRKPKD